MVDDINAVLTQILNDFVNSTSEFVFYAKLIAGLAAIIAAFIAYRKIQMDGDMSSINNFVIKITLVFLGIVFYGTLLKFINAPLDLLTANVKQVSIGQYQQTTNIFSQNYQNMSTPTPSANQQYDEEINQLLSEDSSPTSNDPNSQAVLNSTTDTSNADWFTSMINQAIFQLLSFVASICLVILNIIRTFYLIVLSLFGIFVIAFSLFPGFENSFGQWIQKYVNIYLWLPVAYILDGILSRLFAYQGVTDGPVQGQSMISPDIINMMALCAIITYATVPTLTSWMVNASTGGMASKLKGKGESMGKMASKAVASGGASTASSAATSAASGVSDAASE